jgi:hypothetical protein
MGVGLGGTLLRWWLRLCVRTSVCPSSGGPQAPLSASVGERWSLVAFRMTPILAHGAVPFTLSPKGADGDVDWPILWSRKLGGLYTRAAALLNPSIGPVFSGVPSRSRSFLPVLSRVQTSTVTATGARFGKCTREAMVLARFLSMGLLFALARPPERLVIPGP